MTSKDCSAGTVHIDIDIGYVPRGRGGWGGWGDGGRGVGGRREEEVKGRRGGEEERARRGGVSARM